MGLFEATPVGLCLITWTFCILQFGAVAVLKGHSATVTMATGMSVPGSSVDCTCTLIATTSADSSVKVWQRKSRGGE